MRILLVEDDQKLCSLVKAQLAEQEIECDICNDGADAFHYAKTNAYDVIVLDRMLPHKDGITIIDELREHQIETPVIFVTALGQLNDRVNGLNHGADDYLSKPFEIVELVARIHALARRRTKSLTSNVHTFGDFEYDFPQLLLTHTVTKKTCHISKRESELLSFFITNEGQILSRDLILDRIWGIDSDIMESNLDNFICFLRKRLKSIDSKCIIKTYRGTGYALLKGE